LVDTGPGEALKIHAWTCDEELGACRLMVHIPAVGMDTNSYPEVVDTDVSGAVNAYFQKPGDGLGDNSLDGRLYVKRPSPLSFDEYVAKQNNKTALRFPLGDSAVR